MDQTGEIGRLLAQLRTDDPPVEADVERAVLAQLRAKDAALVSEALAVALEDADPEYRCTVANVFLDWDFVAALGHARSLLRDENDDVRGFLCQTLGYKRRREAVPLLVEALRGDADGSVRTWAAWALGNIGDPAALPALKLAMQNDEGADCEGRPVKEIAAEAIRRITQEKVAASVA